MAIFFFNLRQREMSKVKLFNRKYELNLQFPEGSVGEGFQ